MKHKIISIIISLIIIDTAMAQGNAPVLKGKYLGQKPPGMVATLPTGRSQHAAAFEDETGKMLILGGVKHYKNTNPSPLTIDNKLWAWKNSNWEVISENGPSLRNDAKMVYHEKNKKTYLYGGRSYDSTGKTIVFDDFWEWNGRSWNLLSPSNAPGKIVHSNMVYDARRNRIVLFGGVISGHGFLNTVWEWDGTDWQRIKSINPPSPRIAHSMVYSPALKKVLIIGGVNQEGKNLREIWSWDGKSFELIDNNFPDIEQGNYNAVSIDEGRNVKLLLVGRPGRLDVIKEIKQQENQCDTWLWNAKTWTQLKLNSAPSLREGQSLVYDKNNRQVILFGGSAREEAGYDNPNDVWIFKNGEWRFVW